MLRLPTEIQHRIFELACTDGGRAGCTLSLASRQVAERSRPWRYQSVVLIGSRTMLLFALAVAVPHLQNGNTLGTRWLFASDHRAPPSDSNDGQDNLIWYQSPYFAKQRAATSLKSLRRMFSRRSARRHMVNAHIQGVNAALNDILAACSGTLLTLHIYLAVAPLFVVIPMFMPVLEDFTLVVIQDAVSRQGALIFPTPVQVMLPALRRLCLLPFPFATRSAENVTHLLTMAPSISHIRLGEYGYPVYPTLYHSLPVALPDSIQRIELFYTLYAAVVRSANYSLLENELHATGQDGLLRPRVFLVFNGEWNGHGTETPRWVINDWFKRNDGTHGGNGGCWARDDDIPLRLHAVLET